MNAHFAPSEELDQLLSTLADGELESGQRAQLNEIIADDSEARDYYVSYICTHAMLQWRHGGVPVMEVPLDLAGPLSSPSRNIFGWWIAGGVAASLLVAVGFAYWFGHTYEPPVAMLIDAEDVRWQREDVEPKPGDEFRARRFHIARGIARFRLSSGVVIALEGPGELELKKGNSARLHKGHARIFVPPRGTGFKLAVSRLEIADVGTDFGVSISELKIVQVHVFRGAVNISGQVKVKANQAVLVDAEYSTFRDIPADPLSFPTVRRGKGGLRSMPDGIP